MSRFTGRRTMAVELAQTQCDEIDAFLAERIYDFNANATGFVDGEDFAATVRDSSARIIAGASGYTWGGCCHLSQLWVHESARKQGLGTSLIVAVEAHAVSKGCSQIVLSSHSFQAPDFYRRLGYVEQAVIPGYPRGHSDIHFAKRLDRHLASD